MHVRWSHEAPRPETDLVVFLHGFGADENDLFPLGNYFDDRFTIASVQAPERLPPHFGGYCWFRSPPHLMPTLVTCVLPSYS